jgi:hypothetical protein
MAALAHISAAIANETALPRQRAIAVWSAWTARNFSSGCRRPKSAEQWRAQNTAATPGRSRCSTEYSQALGGPEWF